MIEDFDIGTSKKSFSKASISEIIPRNDLLATDYKTPDNSNIFFKLTHIYILGISL